MNKRKQPKCALYDVFSSRPKRSTPKAKKCPVKAYFEAVRIVELTRYPATPNSFKELKSCLVVNWPDAIFGQGFLNKTLHTH